MNIGNNTVLAFVWLILAMQLEKGTKVERVLSVVFLVGALCLFVTNMSRG